MGEVEEELLVNFCLNLPRYLPEALGFAPLEKVPIGNYEGSGKEIDLLLIQKTHGILDSLNYLGEIGTPLPRKSKGPILSMLPPDTSTWIVEAESSKTKLWEGIGQSFGYRALLSLAFRNLRIMGSVVIYPEDQGIDQLIEEAVEVIKNQLHVDLRIIRVAVTRKPRKNRENEDLRKFGEDD